MYIFNLKKATTLYVLYEHDSRNRDNLFEHLIYNLIILVLKFYKI